MLRRSFLSLVPCSGALLLRPSASRAAAPSIRYGYVFKATPEHPRNDTANVLELRDGSLLVVWHKYYANELKTSDFGMARIHSRISRDGGVTWTDDRMLVDCDPGDLNVQAPGLCRTRKGDILLNCLRAHAKDSTSMFVFRSTDEGRTFREYSRVWQHSTGQWLQGGASGVVRLESGRLVMPYHFGSGDQGHEHCRASCFLSDDDGATWQRARTEVDLPMRGAMEASVAEHPDGFLAMSLRTQLGAVYLSISRDQGETWTPPQTTGLKAPESCTCLRRIPGTKNLVLFWNDSLFLPNYDHSGKRTPLTAAVSSDGGTSWRRIGNIETEDAWFTNVNCTFVSNGSAVLTYFHGPSTMPKNLIDLKAAVIERSWFG
jgi:sialidase-1